jgi:hypothetical protein
MCVCLSWMNFLTLADKSKQRRRQSAGPRIMAWRRSGVQPTHVLVEHEAIVHEIFFVHTQGVVLLFQRSGPIASNTMPQDEVLSAGRSAYRIGLNESNPS